MNVRERVISDALTRYGITDPSDVERSLASPVVRRALTRRDPLVFACLYLWRHLSGPATGGEVSFAEAHLEWAAMAATWTKAPGGDTGPREAIIAPRETGKSTWWFLLLPMWAAAHGHVKFAAAFADSASQAETHLATFKHELETNAALREDYPELTAPRVRNRGAVAADRVSQYQAESGFVFAARGITSSTLGLKVGELRPDLIILDDIEPDEASYSSDQMTKRLGTLTDAILPLSTVARVVVVGTVTMEGSIVHQLSKAAKGLEVSDWIVREGFVGHHYLPILTDDDGAERSMWPERWSLEWLLKMRGSRTFAKNYLNDPVGADGDYWTLPLFRHERLEACPYVLLSVDPAVTSKASSDQTGIAVLGFQPRDRRVEVRKAFGVRLAPEGIRARVLAELADDPTIGLVLVETNQGGEVWRSILHDLPVPITTVHQSEKKEVRAATVANDYVRERVVHAPELAGGSAEGQMAAFPRGPHDDIVDAIVSGVNYFLHRKRKKKATASSLPY